jgi:hypothetical protein
MTTPPPLSYPSFEQNLRSAIGVLQKEWRKVFQHPGVTLTGNASADDFVEDGFYPHYTNMSGRILYIGREARDLGGCNYLDYLGEAYLSGKRVGMTPLNRSMFHARLLRIAWGILRGFPDWDNLPTASAIGDCFGQTGGISFAFMNLSKLSNQRGDSQKADWKQIRLAAMLSTTPRNFIAEEIELLAPHIVITANLSGFLGQLGTVEPLEGVSGLVDAFQLQAGNHRCLLLNTFHFSARKGSRQTFYDPVCKMLKKYSETLSARSHPDSVFPTP